jgi:hypothetical protein
MRVAGKETEKQGKIEMINTKKASSYKPESQDVLFSLSELVKMSLRNENFLLKFCLFPTKSCSVTHTPRVTSQNSPSPLLSQGVTNWQPSPPDLVMSSMDAPFSR